MGRNYKITITDGKIKLTGLKIFKREETPLESFLIEIAITVQGKGGTNGCK